MIQFKIDVTDAIAGLNELKGFKSAIANALEKQAKVIQEKARKYHRYIRRTGTLENATVAEATEMDIIGYINESQAPYGKYVHEGHGTWAPDPFLEEAFESYDLSILEKAIDDEILNAGLA